jgi:hypothetical protein
LASRRGRNSPLNSLGLPLNFGLNGVKALSDGKTMTTVGTAVAVKVEVSTRPRTSRKFSKRRVISRRSPALTSPTTVKCGLSIRCHSALAGMTPAKRMNSVSGGRHRFVTGTSRS